MIGKVVNYEYSIPRGDWFELVSCPHYFAEIMIYLSISVVLECSTIWWTVCLFVAINQIMYGLFTHQWYHDHFKNYPKKRKAIIPYII